MGEEIAGPVRAGFRGSETTGAEVSIYRKGGDRVLMVSGSYALNGKLRSGYAAPALTGITINKQLGGLAGTFTITAKGPKSGRSILDEVVDDDWIDIVLLRHRTRYHVLRGLVDDIRRFTRTNSSGATVEQFTITGRDFQKVWETTPIEFLKYTAENVAGAWSLRLMGGENVAGDVRQVVELFLFGFVRELNGVGRSNWKLPASMPNKVATFGDTVSWDALDYNAAGALARVAVNPSFMAPSGRAWDLAKEWSDPLFCELYTELLSSSAVRQGGSSDIPNTLMKVVLRDKPFPVVDTTLPNSGRSSPWFSLPLFTIPRQDVTERNIGRSGSERYNAFFVSPQLVQELLGTGGIDLAAPLWDSNDILNHGLRRFDVTSRYMADQAQILTLAENQRKYCRDWYAINPYLYSGNLILGRGFPEIKVGVRVRIPGTRSPNEDETYYCEGYAHSWSPLGGIRTSLTVTRGWIGTDDSLLNAIAAVTAGYRIPTRNT